MNESYLIVIAAVILILIVLPPKWDPAIRIKEKQTRDDLSPEERQRLADCNAINKGICPDCGAAGSLCEGPSGGMSQNIACDACLMEFNVGFGFGTGAFMVDRTGKLPASRAASAFGITVP